jgi:hypothetical protein
MKCEKQRRFTSAFSSTHYSFKTNQYESLSINPNEYTTKSSQAIRRVNVEMLSDVSETVSVFIIRRKILNPNTADSHIEGAHDALTISTTTDEGLDILMWKLTESHEHVLLYF